MSSKKMSKFNFSGQFGWSEIIAIAAFIIAGVSLYLQYVSNKAYVSLTHDKVISTIFTDKDGQKKFFGYHRATIFNNGSKPVTLLGLKPHEKLGLILTQKKGFENLEKDRIKFKIFQIPDTILSESIFNNEKNLWDFQDHGLEKMSIINKIINPGEVYVLNIGTIFDIFSDTKKEYRTIIFSSELTFSNGQKLIFGAAADILPIK